MEGSLVGLLDRIFGTSKREGRAHEQPLDIENLGSEVSPRDQQWQRVLDRFYALQEQIEQAQRRHDLTTALDTSTRALDMLPDFVEAWRREEMVINRGALSDEWFPIKSVVAIETICRLAPARQDEGRLELLRSKVEAIPELAPWKEMIDEAVATARAAGKVTAAIKTDPGVKQAGLAKSLGLDGQQVRQLLYWMEADGAIIRRKTGSTYELHLRKTGTSL